MLNEVKHPYGLGFSRGPGCFGGPQQDTSPVKLIIAVLALENLRYFGGLRGLSRPQIDDRAHHLLTMLDLIEQRNIEVRKFSRGMQQKVAIANALMHDPDILVLDEPTLGLDVAAARLLEETVANLAAAGKAVLLTTHVMDLAQRLAGRIFVIHQGREVAHDKTAVLLQQFDARPVTLIKMEQMPTLDWQQRFMGQFPGLNVQNGLFEWTAPSQPQILSLYSLLDEASSAVLALPAVSRLWKKCFFH